MRHGIINAQILRKARTQNFRGLVPVTKARRAEMKQAEDAIMEKMFDTHAHYFDEKYKEIPEGA